LKEIGAVLYFCVLSNDYLDSVIKNGVVFKVRWQRADN